MPIKRKRAESLLLFERSDTYQGSVRPVTIDPEQFRLHYEHPHGKLYQGDSIAWLGSLVNQSVDLIFADPPYNINKAEWEIGRAHV